MKTIPFQELQQITGTINKNPVTVEVTSEDNPEVVKWKTYAPGVLILTDIAYERKANGEWENPSGRCKVLPKDFMRMGISLTVWPHYLELYTYE
jgi:hypothetical protein